MIKTREEEIKELLKANVQAQKAFDKMLSFYQVLDKLNLSSHVKLIESIYKNNDFLFTWQLANIANISNETCYRYRKKYIKCFYLCLNF